MNVSNANKHFHWSRRCSRFRLVNGKTASINVLKSLRAVKGLCSNANGDLLPVDNPTDVAHDFLMYVSSHLGSSAKNPLSSGNNLVSSFKNVDIDLAKAV